MNHETIEALKMLAAKLGTTSEYLWGVLLRQALLSGMEDLLMLVFLSFLSFKLFKLVQKKTFLPPENKYGYSDWGEEAWIFFGMIEILVLIFAISLFADMVNAFFNPEYWALKQILR